MLPLVDKALGSGGTALAAGTVIAVGTERAGTRPVTFTVPAAGWALDATGNPTTDPAAAMKGALLAFGGGRGANIALMVEMLAAGVTGANWSLDAPSFMEGAENPGTGLFVVAIEPKLLDPDFERRAGEQVERLRRRYGVHSPGRAGAEAAEQAAARGVTVSREVVQRISDYASRYDG